MSITARSLHKDEEIVVGYVSQLWMCEENKPGLFHNFLSCTSVVFPRWRMTINTCTSEGEVGERHVEGLALWGDVDAVMVAQRQRVGTRHERPLRRQRTAAYTYVDAHDAIKLPSHWLYNAMFEYSAWIKKIIRIKNYSDD